MESRTIVVLIASICLALAQNNEEKEKAAAPPATETPAEVATPTAPEEPAKADPKAYIIGSKDVLLIRVWREPELSGPVVVRPDGRITLQLLNEVQAAGLTPQELSAVIRKGLAANYMNKPEVTVTVTAIHSKEYFIQGEVMRPGAYPLLVPTTVLEALVNAGGFRDFADQKGIFVMRGGTRYKFNYKDVIRGKKMEQNIPLQPGDHIIVP
ncbi:MAG: polysaccharide biosynthesis/export family protein [Bryobacteraceae bacterium]